MKLLVQDAVNYLIGMAISILGILGLWIFWPWVFWDFGYFGLGFFGTLGILGLWVFWDSGYFGTLGILGLGILGLGILSCSRREYILLICFNMTRADFVNSTGLAHKDFGVHKVKFQTIQNVMKLSETLEQSPRNGKR